MKLYQDSGTIVLVDVAMATTVASNWAAVEELQFSYHNFKTLLFGIYPDKFKFTS